MHKKLSICALPLLAVASSVHGASTKNEDARSRLEASIPGVRFNPAPLEVDVDCDGKVDYVFMGQTPAKIWVGVVRGDPRSAPTSSSFAVGTGSQDSLCSGPATVDAESLNYDPADAVGNLPGFKRSRSCKSFVLSGGECDPFHFYWNHQTKQLQWWRL